MTDPVKPGGLGRIQVTDPADRLHLLSAAPDVQTAPAQGTRYHYDNVWWGDQGNTPQCTAYSGLHYAEDKPITPSGAKPFIQPTSLYEQAQMLDGIAGPHEGSTVRAIAKVFQSLGLVAEYQWAFDLNTLVKTVLDVGPVIMGTDWYYSMFFPKSIKGRVTIAIDDTLLDPDFGDPISGGHAWVINGVNTADRVFRMKNSWGRTWGSMGRAYVSFNDVERLLHQDGEAMLAREVK